MRSQSVGEKKDALHSEILLTLLWIIGMRKCIRRRGPRAGPGETGPTRSKSTFRVLNSKFAQQQHLSLNNRHDCLNAFIL